MSLLGLPTPPAWMADASCAQIGVGMADMWFPEKGGRNTDARDFCTRCPVAGECLTYALDYDIRDGYWGGLSAHERDVLTGRRAS